MLIFKHLLLPKRTVMSLIRQLSTGIAALFMTLNPAWADFGAGLDAYTSGSFEQAAREWAPLAEQGEVDAQYHLALLYEEGQGVEKNDDLARFWYLRAAQKGYVDAFFALGDIYAAGRGTEPDRSLAYHWYTMAAASGHARAKEVVGRFAPKLSTQQMAESGRITKAWTLAHVH
jgi:TPR repeat protein